MSGAVDPLSGLRGYHLPEAVSWWPPALGWWLLLGLLLALLVSLVLLRRRARRQRQPSALAARELAVLRAAHRADGDGLAYVRGLSQLLRRFALARYPGDVPAGLCGEAWLAFLAGKENGEVFKAGVGRRFADAPYRADLDVDVHQLERAATGWINGNRRARR